MRFAFFCFFALLKLTESALVNFINGQVFDNLNFVFNQAYTGGALGIAALSGLVPNVPSTSSIIDPSPNMTTGPNQQAFWSLFNVYEAADLGNGAPDNSLLVYTHSSRLMKFHPAGGIANAAEVSCTPQSAVFPASASANTTNCRSGYIWNFDGSLATKAWNTGTYNTTARPWYSYTTAFGKPCMTQPFAFASDANLGGLSFCYPLYSTPGVNTSPLVQIVVADIVSTQTDPVMVGLSVNGLVTSYVMYGAGVPCGPNSVTPSCPYGMWATSTAEVTFNKTTGKFRSALTSKNLIVSSSANYLINVAHVIVCGSGSDGSYQYAYEGTTYDIVLKTWNDAWNSLEFKVVSVLASSTATPMGFAPGIAKMQVSRYTQLTYDAGLFVNFLTGTNTSAPLSIPAISTVTAGAAGSSTQQGLWAIWNTALNSPFIVNIGIAYPDNSFVSYFCKYATAASTVNSCTTMFAYSAGSSLQLSTVSASGAPQTLVSTVANYAPTTTSWYNTGYNKNGGFPTWTAPFVDTTFTNNLVLMFSTPLFYMNNFLGVTFASLNVAYLSSLCQQYASFPDMVVYIYDPISGCLVGSSDAESLINGTSCVLAKWSSNSLITYTFNYINDAQDIGDGMYMTSYSATQDLCIEVSNFIDMPTYSLPLQIVSATLTTVTASPTMAPTASKISSSNDNNDSSIAASASTAAAVLTSILVLLIAYAIYKFGFQSAIGSTQAHDNKGVTGDSQSDKSLNPILGSATPRSDDAAGAQNVL